MTAIFIQQVPLSCSGEFFLGYFVWFLTAQKIILLLCSLGKADQRQVTLEPAAQFYFYIIRTFLPLTQEEQGNVAVLCCPMTDSKL